MEGGDAQSRHPVLMQAERRLCVRSWCAVVPGTARIRSLGLPTKPKAMAPPYKSDAYMKPSSSLKDLTNVPYCPLPPVDDGQPVRPITVPGRAAAYRLKKSR